MTGTAKIAGVAILVGLMLAAIAGMAIRSSAPRETPATPARAPHLIAADQLARCRTLTAPDADCAAAWEAERRRFFRDDAR